MDRPYITDEEMSVPETERQPEEQERPDKEETVDESDVKQPDNPEAIVEGLLYLVGEDGARAEQLAAAIGVSMEDIGIILENIRHKYASELIIAYKQPITRVEIEELRGVSAEVMLRKLQARNLIREAGRSEAVGRPILYEVTEEFMDSFKLYTLNELPDLPEYNKEEESENLFE